MGILTPGWLKKALHLRTTVSCSPVQELSDDQLELYDAMRDFNRDTIDEATFLRRSEEIMARNAPRIQLLHEPATIYGWYIDAAIYSRKGVVYWLVHVSRTSPAPVTAKDKAMLTKIMGALGCEDMERDQISVSDFDDIIANGTPVVYGWRNAIELNEIQVNPELAKVSQDPQKIMRIVPRGTRPSEGFVRMDKTGTDS